MARYILEVMYDGICFHGSQIQGELATVQLAVNKAIATITRQKVETFGASRTDEGVHALSNFYHFDLDIPLIDNFLYKCNAIMPAGLAAIGLYAATGEFNARFDAQSRSYRYRIYRAKNPFLANRAYHYPYRIDENILNETSAIIKDNTHFKSFAKRNSQVKTFECNIYNSFWERNGEELHYCVTANRFLRGMVRGLVATQLRAARGNFPAEHISQIISYEDCTKAFFDVPGHGLYLEQIAYPDGIMQLIQKI